MLAFLFYGGPSWWLSLKEDHLSPFWLNLTLILCIDMYRTGSDNAVPPQLALSKANGSRRVLCVAFKAMGQFNDAPPMAPYY